MFRRKQKPRLLRSLKRGQDLIHDVENSVQDVHEWVNENEQFMQIFLLIFPMENLPTRSKVKTREDTKSKRESKAPRSELMDELN